MGKTSVALVLAVLGTLWAGSSASAQCETTDADMDGVPDVCPAGSTYIEGTAAGDLLFGTAGPDCIFGFGGADLIFAFGGDDYICGGDGGDIVFGSGGSDSIFGEGGDDLISAGGGADVVNGGDGDDDLFGGGGADSISGGAGNDDLIGGGGNDALSGGEGEDNLDGGGGTNECVEEVPGTSERLENCAAITFASVARFDVAQVGADAIVTWETTTEVGAVAFRVWRLADDGRFTFVGEVKAARDGSVHGGTYFLRDSGDFAGEVRYVLEERTVSGASVQYGPYVRSPRRMADVDRLAHSFRTSRRIARAVELRRSMPFARRLPVRTAKSGASDMQAVVVVDAEGLIEVDAIALANAMGRPGDELRGHIADGTLRLELAGASVAWEPTEDGEAIRFVAPAPRSPFAAHHRYLISVASGTRMEEASFLATGAGPAHTYVDIARFEENLFPGITGNPDPRQDLFFWHALVGDEEVTVPIELTSLASESAIAVRVELHGATEHPDQRFEVELRWNDESLGHFTFTGRRSHTIEVPVDALDTDSEVDLTLVQHQDGNALPVVYLDAVEVEYLRRAEAAPTLTRFTAAGERDQSVTGFSFDTLRLYDVTDPASPISYGMVPLLPDGEAHALHFEAEASRRFVAFGPEAATAPTEVYGRARSTLRDITIQADYVVIAASHLVDAAEVLADLRRNDGYRVLVVDVDDVYWDFAAGVADPAAVRAFLAHAWETWETPPRFAALVGEGNFDYRDLQGLGGNAIPPMLTQTGGGLFPSDSMLGDVVDDDGIPEIAVGRLPVLDADELAAHLDAIRTFEATRGEGAILAASDEGKGADFGAASRVLRGLLPASRTFPIDLDELALEEARAELFVRWQAPLDWLTFVGHGGVDRLSNLGLLTTADLDGLDPPSAPVFAAFTCNIGRFDIPGFRGLGQELVTRGLGSGVFSATGWSNHPATDALRTAWMAEAFASDQETIGDVMLAAHRAASAAPVELHRVYGLLGDPALRLRDKQEPPMVEPPGQSDPPEGPIDPGAVFEDGSTGCAVAQDGRGSRPLIWTWMLAAFVLLGRRRGRARRIH